MGIRHVKVSISLKSLLLVGFVGLIALGMVHASGIILSILTAVVFASFVMSIARAFMKVKIPRVAAVVLVYLLSIVVFGGIIYLFLPVFFEEVSGIVGLLPDSAFSRIVEIFNNPNTGGLLGNIESTTPSELIDGLGGVAADVGGGIVEALSVAVGGLVNFVLIIVISFYLSLEDKGVEKFLRAVIPVEHEAYVISIWHRVEHKIGMWFRGQLLSAFILAVMTYVGLLLLKIPYALILSLLVGVFGLIPFGIIIASLAAIVLALFTSGGQAALLVLILYVLLQQFEEYVLHPLIINKATGVPSIVILLSLVIGVKLAGFLGLILALPAAMVVIELLNDYEKRKVATLTKQSMMREKNT